MAISFAPGADPTVRRLSLRWAGAIALASLCFCPAHAAEPWVPTEELALRTSECSSVLLATSAPRRDIKTAGSHRRAPANSKSLWKSRASVVPFENFEGVIMVPTTIRSVDGRDTTGVLVLDTGAGYVALDA